MDTRRSFLQKLALAAAAFATEGANSVVKAATSGTTINETAAAMAVVNQPLYKAAAIGNHMARIQSMSPSELAERINPDSIGNAFNAYFDKLDEFIGKLNDARRSATAQEVEHFLSISEQFAKNPQSSIHATELGHKIREGIRTGDFTPAHEYAKIFRENISEAMHGIAEKRTQELNRQQNQRWQDAVTQAPTLHIHEQLTPNRYRIHAGNETRELAVPVAHENREFRKRFLKTPGVSGWVVRGQEKSALLEKLGEQTPVPSR